LVITLCLSRDPAPTCGERIKKWKLEQGIFQKDWAAEGRRFRGDDCLLGRDGRSGSPRTYIFDERDDTTPDSAFG